MLETTFDSDGIKPTRLKWKISKELDDEIKDAMEFYKSNTDDLDLIVVDHQTYGKGEIKKSMFCLYLEKRLLILILFNFYLKIR